MANVNLTPLEIDALMTVCTHELGCKEPDRSEAWPHLVTAYGKLETTDCSHDVIGPEADELEEQRAGSS